MAMVYQEFCASTIDECTQIIGANKDLAGNSRPYIET